MKPQAVQLSRGNLRRAIHKALRLWDLPTREGLEVFTQMLVPSEFGLKVDSRTIDSRIAINSMLKAYIDDLGRLQPHLVEILTRRFYQREATKILANDLNFSQEQINRLQKHALVYLAELIYDDEVMLRSVPGFKKQFRKFLIQSNSHPMLS